MSSVAAYATGVPIPARVAEIQALVAPKRANVTRTDANEFDSALQHAQLQQAQSTASLSSVLTALGVTGPARGPAAGTAVVETAMQYLGVPYVWGGNDPATGLDCSGFTKLVYGQHGVTLPRVSTDQARTGTPVASLAEAKPGDLLAFGSPVDHVAIYLGDNRMIHAAGRGKGVRIDDVYRTPTAIRRVLPDHNAVATPGVWNPLLIAAPAQPHASPAGATGEAAFMPLFQAAGARYGVDPALLSAVARAESGYNPAAVSRAGALGLMQIMPATAAGLGVDPRDPAQAVDGAARYLAAQLERFGSVELALAAYNAGPGAVERYGGIPPYAETQNYVKRVLGYHAEAIARMGVAS